MSLARPTIVLLDMDGTTVRHINPRILGILEFLDDLSYKLTGLFRRKQELQLLEEHNKKPRLLVHRAIHRFRRRPVEQIVQPCPGIYALLNLLKSHNIPTGVVSNGLGKGYGHDILEKFHLNTLFDAQIFREDIGRSKPHPDPILRALKAIKDPVEPDDIIWYIGDRHKDISAALAADKVLPCKVVPFAYGLNAALAVLENGIGQDHIIMNYQDFSLRVKEILEKKSKATGPISNHANDNTTIAA